MARLPSAGKSRRSIKQVIVASAMSHSKQEKNWIMSVADKALWVIERNSAQPLTLNSIAEACGVSRLHLANAFGTASGWPVMKYLKARRLSEAARQLADGAPDILTVALEFGYGSHEAFTRAFRDQFGATPEQVRNGRNLDGLILTSALRLRSGQVRPPIPILRTLDRLRLGRILINSRQIG
jgi:AraC family transcriptional regulator